MRDFIKYFILLVFSFFLFDIAYASEIKTYTSGYSLVSQCSSNMCDFPQPSNSSKRVRLSPDTLSASANATYDNTFNFSIISSYSDLNVISCAYFINGQQFTYISETYNRVYNGQYSSNKYQADFTFMNVRTFASTQTYSSFVECETNVSAPMYRISFTHVLGTSSNGSSADIINNNNANTQTIVNNNNSNTQNIIDNQNQNTQDIIDNQNENTEKEIESQKVCKSIDKNNIVSFNKWYDRNGNLNTTSNNYIGISNKIRVSSSDDLKVSYNIPNLNYTGSLCFFNNLDSLISCVYYPDISSGDTITIPNNSFYFIATLRSDTNMPQLILCKGGNQALSDDINDLNNTLNDSNVDSNSFSDWLDSFSFFENSYFSSLITSPINFINSLDDTCSPITLTLFGQNVVLPCGTDIFWELNNSYISNFRAFWNILFGGFLIYKLGSQLIITVNDALDPTKDSIGGSII